MIRLCICFDVMSNASCHVVQIIALVALLANIVKVGMADCLWTKLIKNMHATAPACGAVQLYDIT